MTSIPNYLFQILVLVGLCTAFQLRSKTLDLYVVALLSIWSIGVFAIFYRYGVDQVLFYSNDQEYFKRVIEAIPEFGIQFSLWNLGGGDYPITLPALLLTKLGFDTVLAVKFLQLVALLFIYHDGRKILNRFGITVVGWHLVFFCGPLFLFMSLLGLRDLVIAYFVMQFFYAKAPTIRIVALLATFMFRPHLFIALIVGWVVGMIWSNKIPRFYYFLISALVVGMYFFGALAYHFGGAIQNGMPLTTAKEIFSQTKFSRLAANFLSLQFLTLGDSAKLSFPTLLSTRLIFIDTFLIPGFFLLTLLKPSKKWSALRLQVFASFIFFYGIISQTPYNSSRQNIPFLLVMGLACLITSPILNKHDGSNSAVLKATHNQPTPITL
jgi:hypothetical protein